MAIIHAIGPPLWFLEFSSSVACQFNWQLNSFFREIYKIQRILAEQKMPLSLFILVADICRGYIQLFLFISGPSCKQDARYIVCLCTAVLLSERKLLPAVLLSQLHCFTLFLCTLASCSTGLCSLSSCGSLWGGLELLLVGFDLHETRNVTLLLR